MPIYGYRCKQCGHEMEVKQSISDQPLHTCPVCNGQLQKQLYPVGVIYKGSGYYSTDYRGSRPTESGSSGSDSKPASDGGGAAKEAGSNEKSGSKEKSASKEESGSKEKSGSTE